MWNLIVKALDLPKFNHSFSVYWFGRQVAGRSLTFCLVFLAWKIGESWP